MFTWYDTHLRNLKAELQNNVLFSRHWAALFWACFIASALMVSSGVDQSLAEFFLNPDHVFIWQRFRDFTNVGLAEPYFALSLGAWLCGRYIPSFISSQAQEPLRTHWQTLARWGKLFLVSLITSGIAVHALKFLVGRQRPHKSIEHTPFVFEPFNWHWHWQSFPSGHSQVMMVVAFWLSLLLPKFRKLIFALALLVCFSRVGTGDHFLSDTIMGGVIGLLISRWILTGDQKNNQSSNESV